MDSRAGGGFEPQVRASKELYWRQDLYEDLAEAGVTTLGLTPAGSAIPGQAVAVQPDGGNPPIVQASPIDGAAVSAAPAEGVPIGVKCGAPSSSRLSR